MLLSETDGQTGGLVLGQFMAYYSTVSITKSYARILHILGKCRRVESLLGK